MLKLFNPANGKFLKEVPEDSPAEIALKAKDARKAETLRFQIGTSRSKEIFEGGGEEIK